MSSFSDLAETFLKEEFAESPVLASSLGLTEYDEMLDDLSADAFRRHEERSSAWLKRFSAVPNETLTPAERIDRDFASSILRGRELNAPQRSWQKQPATYLNPGLQGVFSLFLHKLRPEKDLADAARARLAEVPRTLRQGMDNLDFTIVPKIYVDRAIGQARAAAKYARELVPQEVLDPATREQLAAVGGEAGDAFDAFGAFLLQKKDKASGDYAVGEDLYTALLKEKELLAYDARSLRERGREQYDLLAAELRRLAREIANTDDWVGLLDKLNKIHAPTPEAMRDEYAEWTERARSFLRDTGLVTLPKGERCTVEPSPPFQRPILAVASYNRPPAFSDSLSGHFFVPYPPDNTSAEEIQKRLEGNCSAGIPTTAVHEAYPGDHWHLVMAHFNPSKLRQIFSTPYFSEGWALYAERVMREQGFFTDPKHQLYQYEATIFRAARIIVDTSLHLGEMTFDEAVRFMVEKGNLTEPNARAEVGRYCSWPTQASAYLTGMLEIVDVRTRWLAKKGSADVAALREFHDTLTSSGAMPTSLAERALAS
ncbi:MAG TPA: DUF885 domain-containing protein [Chloroflexi bacterium]|jgi:uncharacterized protein (DUF885 family)|nr:DUF885 domain-containing protein [Chloroflexota bacterium]HAL25935.1 DUF885 domain-containing protein [Chloroflexota bacterium]